MWMSRGTIPRLDCLGLIEAAPTGGATEPWLDGFRGLIASASLKRLFLTDEAKRETGFRGLIASASLKLFQFVAIHGLSFQDFAA